MDGKLRINHCPFHLPPETQPLRQICFLLPLPLLIRVCQQEHECGCVLLLIDLGLCLCLYSGFFVGFDLGGFAMCYGDTTSRESYRRKGKYCDSP